MTIKGSRHLGACQKANGNHIKRERRTTSGATLGRLLKMANMGKVKRVIREAVAVLVDEVGRDEAADLLETAVAQLRGGGDKPKQATVPKIKARLQTGEKLAIGSKR